MELLKPYVTEEDKYRRAVTKTAAMGSSIKNFGKKLKESDPFVKMVAGIGAATILTEFVKKMIQYGKSKAMEMKEPEYYKKMLEENPQLSDKDPQTVMDLWNTLYHNSPHMAKDPVAAGAFITQNIQNESREEFGGPTIDTYKTLTDIQNNQEGADTSSMPGSDKVMENITKNVLGMQA